MLSTVISTVLWFGWEAAGNRSALSSDASARSVRLQKTASPAAGRAITHGSRTERRIALTFDACSTHLPSHYDERVTRVLVETRTPATVFLGGKWIEEEEEHTRYLASMPQFELGNHTFLHPHMTQVSNERIREELESTQRAIYRVTGKTATLFRPPYGEYDDRVLKISAEMGLTTIEYDLPSGDPDIHATKEKLVEYVTSMARNGSIVVMHINQRGWHTSEALPAIISNLRNRGFRLVTVGELLRASRMPIKAGADDFAGCSSTETESCANKNAAFACLPACAPFAEPFVSRINPQGSGLFRQFRIPGDRLLTTPPGVLFEYVKAEGRKFSDLVE